MPSSRRSTNKRRTEVVEKNVRQGALPKPARTRVRMKKHRQTLQIKDGNTAPQISVTRKELTTQAGTVEKFNHRSNRSSRERHPLPARPHFVKTLPRGLQREAQQKRSNVTKHSTAVRDVKTSHKIFSNISVPSAPKNRIPGKQNETFVDSGLFWFPAASKIDSTCDWKIPSNVRCLNRHLAFVHLYPVSIEVTSFSSAI